MVAPLRYVRWKMGITTIPLGVRATFLRDNGSWKNRTAFPLFRFCKIYHNMDYKIRKDAGAFI
jgi:hypothetical protein